MPEYHHIRLWPVKRVKPPVALLKRSLKWQNPFSLQPLNLHQARGWPCRVDLWTERRRPHTVSQHRIGICVLRKLILTRLLRLDLK